MNDQGNKAHNANTNDILKVYPPTESLPTQYHINFKNNALPLLTQNNSIVLNSRTFRHISSSLTTTLQFYYHG
jgi:hypothetical protein